MSNFYLYRGAIAIASLVILQACASKAVEVEPEVVDNSPLIRTSIIKSNIRSNGFKGNFASDTTHVRKTLANMQRVDNDFRFTGSILGRVGPKSNLSEIIRLDKNLEWHLDNRKKRYSECKVGRCVELAGYKTDLFSGQTAEEVESSNQVEEGVCLLTPTKNKFSVNKTGATRNVNGFEAEEYKIDWQLGFEDEEGRTALNVITIDLWTTAQTGEIAEAIAMEEKFAEARSQRETHELPENLLKAAPRGSLELIIKHMLDDFNAEERAKINGLLASADKIDGFPVSSKFQWDAVNDTCAAPEERVAEKEDKIQLDSFKSLLKSVSKQVVKQEVGKQKDAYVRQMDMQPMLSITEEVTSIAITETRESQLSVPENYRLDNRS